MRADVCVECVSDKDMDSVVQLTRAYMAQQQTPAQQQRLSRELWMLLKPYSTLTLSLLLKVSMATERGPRGLRQPLRALRPH